VGGTLFFSYYDFRPNYQVLDYGADGEVAATLWAAYPVPWLVLVSIGSAAAAFILFAWLAGLSLRDRAAGPGLGWWARLPLVLLLVAIGVLANRGSLASRRINPSLAAFSAHRALNEVAGSGIFNIAYELDQRIQGRYGSLDDSLELLAPEVALDEVREHLSGKVVEDAHNPVLRRIENPPLPLPLNVVLVVMESFTGRLVGSLGGEPSLSPNLDRLADESILLANCYATGERTVQGLEALVASFPSLPGVSVIRRPEAHAGFATLASILKKRGYENYFFYGGDASFDQMRRFFRSNGFDRVVEERDFANPTFRGKWGVSDEDLFRRADREFRNAHREGQPFFGVILTVSLHSPWEYPDGRIQELPADTEIPPGFELEELNNFLYADWAVGEFMRIARKSPYAGNTLFVFAGDHGVHLRGRTILPSEEYRVPVLFHAPRWLEPRRLEGVTSQLDVAPSIMGILGGAYESPFFGSDVLKAPQNGGFAPMIYRKKLHGVRTADRLSVLTSEATHAYAVSPGGEISESPTTAEHRSDARRTLAMLQVAEDLLRSRSFTDR
jgi:phosphoglycerol transferase MdoB-like AlkP superfamily enzyme